MKTSCYAVLAWWCLIRHSLLSLSFFIVYIYILALSGAKGRTSENIRPDQAANRQQVIAAQYLKTLRQHFERERQLGPTTESMNYKSGERVGQQASQQDRSGEGNRTRSSSVPYDNQAASYIHMSSQSLTGGAPHLRDDSGYTQSTIGSSVPPMNTIGIKRGNNILRSRPYGSEPPNANGGEEARTMARFDNPDDVPDLDVPYFFNSEQDGRDLDADRAMSASAAAEEADATDDMIKADRNFYLLSAKNGQKGHVLSAEALAGEWLGFYARKKLI